jgi:hypothetical protein
LELVLQLDLQELQELLRCLARLVVKVLVVPELLEPRVQQELQVLAEPELAQKLERLRVQVFPA